MAFLLACLIFAYLAVLGLAAASAFDRRISVITALVAPVAGAGVVLPAVLTFNRAGVPIDACGPPVAIGLLGVAVLILALRRPLLPWRAMRPFVPILAASALLAGWPMFVFGFDWLANGNDDMLVYAASALGLMHHGFFALPALGDLISGIDVSQNMWYWEIAPPNRYGIDVFLATVAATARLTPMAIYMPVTIAGLLSLVAAVAAMCSARMPRHTAIVAAVLVGLASPLTLFSVLQQLAPQIFGLAALVAIAAMAQAGGTGRGATAQRGVVLGCACVALMHLYPEISPIAFAAALIWIPLLLWQGRGDAAVPRTLGRVAAFGAATVVVLLNVQLATVAATYRILLSVTTGLGTISEINYFLLPSGVANAWGLVPLGLYPEPWLSISIVAGIAACIGAAIGAVRALPRARYSDAMLVVVQLLCVVLFIHRSSYALFKMVFILQPFLAPLVARALVSAAHGIGARTRIARGPLSAALVACAVAATVYSSWRYLGGAADLFADRSAAYTEILGASRHHVPDELREIARTAGSRETPVRTDAAQTQVAFLEAIALPGHVIEYEALDPYVALYPMAADARGNRMQGEIPGWPRGLRIAARANARARQRAFSQHFDHLGRYEFVRFVPPPVRAADPLFSRAAAGAARHGMLLQTGPHLTVMNRTSASVTQPFDVRAVPWDTVRNWLLLVDSDFGHPPDYPAPDAATAFGAVEPDPYDPGSVFVTVGSSMLLEVLNPAPAVALRLDLSSSSSPYALSELPSIRLIGASTVTLRADGSRGSARLVTPAVRPALIDRHRFVVVVLDRRPERPVFARSPLMSVFGTDIALDSRRFTLFARDISVADRTFPTPSRIARFPHDLLDHGLLYRGAFEDGWLSQKFSVRLRAASAGRILRMRILVPPGRPPSSIDVAVDGVRVRRFIAHPGVYLDQRIAGVGAGDHQVVLTSSATNPIGSRDPRRAWGLVQSLGFEPPGQESTPDVTQSGVAIDDEIAWYPLETYAGRMFRWAQPGASFSIAPGRTNRVLHLELAAGPSTDGAVTVDIGVGSLRKRVVVSSEHDVSLPIPSGTAPQRIVLTFAGGPNAVLGDPRNLTLRVFSARLSAR
jgi:hypothetical protein